MKIAGIDIGTTACKISLYDQDGTSICEYEQEYIDHGKINIQEIDVSEIYESVKRIIKSIAGDSHNLAAIGVTSFGETFVLLDENDHTLMNSMLYTDPRGSEEAEELAEYFGAIRIAEITGHTSGPLFSLPKLMWVKRNHPDLFNKVKHIFLVEDYIVYMLTGKRQIDYSLASRTMAFDIRRLEWSRELLDYAGIPSEMFSEPVPIGTAAGSIRAELAKELGLPETIQIVSISHDQVAACIGAGVVNPGMAADGSGTVECITPVYANIPESMRIQKGKYSVVPFFRLNTYVSYAFSFTGGALLKWFRDMIIHRNDSAFYTEMNSNIKDEPSGLLVLPHFSGAGTPYMNLKAKGAILGLTVHTTDMDIYHALMEGVVFEMMVNVEALKEAGIMITELRASGGGAKSEVWLQMKADILGIKVVSLGTAQCGTLGCIMLSGCACGIYKDLEEAEKVFVKLGKCYQPRCEMHEKYMLEYARYKRLYPAIQEVYKS